MRRWPPGKTPKKSLAFVLASDASEQTHELADAVGAVGYLKKDSGVAAIAPVVLALAALSSTEPPPRPGDVRRG